MVSEWFSYPPVTLTYISVFLDSVPLSAVPLPLTLCIHFSDRHSRLSLLSCHYWSDPLWRAGSSLETSSPIKEQNWAWERERGESQKALRNGERCISREGAQLPQGSSVWQEKWKCPRPESMCSWDWKGLENQTWQWASQWQLRKIKQVPWQNMGS